MSKHIPSLAARAAVVATTAAAAAIVAVHPVAPAPVAGAAPAPAPVAPPVVPAPVVPVALVAPAAPAPAPAAISMSDSALRNALSKLGAPYRYGATGPNAFDCSGLVGWAYRNAGISLPRTSRAQSQIGTPVPRNALRPGDLVFFYKPVSHVGIYVGNGNVVHASTAGSPVKITPIDRMPFNSARRV